MTAVSKRQLRSVPVVSRHGSMFLRSLSRNPVSVYNIVRFTSANSFSYASRTYVCNQRVYKRAGRHNPGTSLTLVIKLPELKARLPYLLKQGRSVLTGNFSTS